MRALIKSSQHQPQRLLASAVGLAVASLAMPALADEPAQLGSVTVKGEQSGYKVERSASAKKAAATRKRNAEHHAAH